MRQVELLIFREIGKADVASAKAAGNQDKTSGGGAQDIRFNPYSAMEPAFRRLLTDPPKPHSGQQILLGPVHWWKDGVDTVETIEFWPPPPKRPTMGRITRLPHIRFFDQMRVDDFDDTKQYLLLLVKELEGPSWMFLLDRQVVDEPAGWDPEVQRFLSQSWTLGRTGSRKFVGYIDFMSGKRVLGGAEDE
jgi:hypothetical protein